MRIYIYSRKSVYTGEGESVENQIEICREYISARIPESDEVEIIVYKDEGFPAKNTGRPQFQKMLRDIRLDKPEYAVYYRLDRISRNVNDSSSLIEDLDNCNISFVCVKEESDTSEPMGKTMMYIASVFAQLERETIAKRVRNNVLMLVRTGHWPDGITPTGFTSEKIQEVIIDGKIRTSCKLKDNPERLKTIDCILEKFLELRSVSGVSGYLVKQGIKSRTGKIFFLLGVKEILQNPICCIADEDAWEYFTEHHSSVCFEKAECSNKHGLLTYNKRDYGKKNIPRQGMDKQIVAIGKHKGRISSKKWVAIQNILKDNTPAGTKPAIIHNDCSLLFSLISCNKCQSRVFAEQRSGKGGNREFYDYICNNKLREGLRLCNYQNLSGQQADDVVCEYLMQYTDENSGTYKLLEKLKQDLQDQTQKNPLSITGDKITRCNSETNNLVNTLSHGNLGTAFIERVNARIMELDKELASMKEEKKYLRRNVSVVTDRETQVDMLPTALSSFKDNFHILAIEEERTLIELMVKGIVWDGKGLHIFTDDEQGTVSPLPVVWSGVAFWLMAHPPRSSPSSPYSL